MNVGLILVMTGFLGAIIRSIIDPEVKKSKYLPFNYLVFNGLAGILAGIILTILDNGSTTTGLIFTGLMVGYGLSDLIDSIWYIAVRD